MISEFAIIKQRKELADTLKDIIKVLKQRETQISEEEAKQLEVTLLSIRIMDWVLSDKEIDMKTFFNDTEYKIAKEIGYL